MDGAFVGCLIGDLDGAFVGCLIGDLVGDIVCVLVVGDDGDDVPELMLHCKQKSTRRNIEEVIKIIVSR